MQIADRPWDWYNSSKAAGQVNTWGVPYGFSPHELPGMNSCAFYDLLPQRNAMSSITVQSPTSFMRLLTLHPSVPWGPTGQPAGYPVLLDVNLNAEGAVRALNYMREGRYLSHHRTTEFTVGGICRDEFQHAQRQPRLTCILE